MNVHHDLRMRGFLRFHHFGDVRPRRDQDHLRLEIHLFLLSHPHFYIRSSEGKGCLQESQTGREGQTRDRAPEFRGPGDQKREPE